MYTKNQLAGRLSVSLSTINRLIARGDIRVVRIGRIVRINDQEITNFTNDSEVSNEG